jgi:hypothetical protein
MVDLDESNNGWRLFDKDFRQKYGDMKILRSLNLSVNSLVKFPSTLEKTIQIVNLSYNKLRSIAGI